MESNDFDELYYICPFRTKWLFESNEIESSRMKEEGETEGLKEGKIEVSVSGEAFAFVKFLR